jgi:hypothetical protein
MTTPAPNHHALDLLCAILDCAERTMTAQKRGPGDCNFTSNFQRCVWQACIQFANWNVIYNEM